MKSLEDTHTQDSDLATLVKECSSLCARALDKVAGLSAERDGFLAENLAASLQQVELILRVIDEQDGPRGDARQSFIKRLFGHGAVSDDGTPPVLEPPSFDVSTQGLLGNSWTVSIAELLGFLAFAHKTGVLWVDSPEENFLIGIVDGRLMHASSDHTPEGLRLGEVLVGLNFLTRRQLERFLAREGTGDGEGVSGEALLESGLISDEELHEALVHQVVALLQRMTGTTRAVFRFQEGVNVQLAFQVDLDINQLLLDCARAGDEESHPAQLAASVMAEWESWRSEVASHASPLQNPEQPADDDAGDAADETPVAASVSAREAKADDDGADKPEDPVKPDPA